MKWAAIFLFLSTQLFATPSERWRDLGRQPLILMDHRSLSAKNCKDCHQSVYDDWSRSRHAVAWSNPIFQEGYLVETQNRCLHCHAPLKPQYDEARGTGKTPLADEGVNCAVCHVRNQNVISARHESADWHPLEKDTYLKSSNFCGSCHQFNINNGINGSLTESKTVAQNTLREWEDYRKQGGTETCQSCHMPQGRHLFHGGHDKEMLRSALRVKAQIVKGFVNFEVASQNIGHNIPTGDVFRQLIFEVRTATGDYQELQRFGRRFTMKFDPTSLLGDLELERNTSLRPGLSVQIKSGLKPPLQYRLRYQYVSDRELKRSHLSSSKLSMQILTGEVLP